MSIHDAEAEAGPLFAATRKVYPQSVSGPYRRTKWIILVLCLGIYYLLPFLRWDRGPNLPNQAILADIGNARFYFFFIELWPQEVYYFTGLLILAAWRSRRWARRRCRSACRRQAS
jgi:polyferredoxin